MPAEGPSPGRGLAGFDRPLLALIAGQIGLHSCMTGVRLAAPLLALRLGFPPLAAGVLLGLFALAPVLLAMPSGRLVDRHGYHRPMRLATLTCVAGLLVALAAAWLAGDHVAGDHVVAAGEGWPADSRVLSAFGVLCLAAVCCGAGANMGLITSQTTAGLRARDAVDRRRVFSWLGLAPSLSNALGPVMAGVLIDAAGYGVAMAALLALPLLAFVAARHVPPSARAEPAAGHGATAPAAPHKLPAWHLFMAPGMRRLLLVNLMLSSAWDLHAFVLPVLGHERGFSASAIGAVLGVFATMVALVRLLIPFVAQQAREHQVLCVAMLWAGAVFAVYPLATSAAQMGVCAAGLGLALGLVQPMVMSALHQLSPPGRHGEAIALRSMTINASSSSLPLLFGLAGGAVGASALFCLMGAVLVLGSVPARRVGRVDADGRSG